MRTGWRGFTKSPGRLRAILTLSAVASVAVPLAVWAINWVPQIWEFNVATDYQVLNAQKIEFVAGPPSLARLKLNTMADHIENSNASFSGTRTALLWPNPPNNHLEFLSTQVQQERPATDSNLVALWRFNEAGGTTVSDTTGSSTNIVANNGTTSNLSPTRIQGWLSDAFGSATNALVFNGASDSVSVPDQAELQLSTSDQVSVEAWVNFTTTSGNQPIIFKGLLNNAGCGGSCYPAYLLSKTATAPPQFAFSIGTLRSVFGTLIQVGTTTTSAIVGGVQPNTWYDVVGTYDPTTDAVAIYVDGSQSGTGATTAVGDASGWDDADPLLLGRGSCLDTSCGGALNGWLDEVAIYKAALSSETIFNNYTLNKVNRFNPRVGSYTSAVIDADPANQIVKQWKTLSWTEGPTSGLGDELATPGPASLVSLWHFNGSAADSKGANSGTPFGSPVFTTGKFANGLYLDGVDDYVNILDTVSLNTPNITIEGWVRFDALTSLASIFNRRTAGNIGGVTLELGGANDISFWAFIGGAWRLVNSGPNAVTTGRWYHLAATYDGSTMRLYINGVQTGTPTISAGAINNPAGPLVQIGRNIFFGPLLRGTIDELAISNTALPASTILTHYRQGSLNLRFQGRSGPTASPDAAWSPWKPTDGAPISNLTYGLVGLWHFDEASGETATDAVGGPTNLSSDNGTLGIAGAGDAAEPFRVPGNPTFANALQFDGVDDYVTIPNSPALTPATLSVEAWVKVTNVASSGWIVHKKIAGGTSAAYGFAVAFNTFAFQVAADSATALDLGPSAVVTSGRWYHLVGTYDGANVRLYVDGLLQATTPSTLTPSYDTSDVYLGRRYDGFLPFNGVIDEVAIYNQPLDEHTILDHYLGSAFTVSPISSTTSIVPENRYAQFRAFFTSDKLALSPELSTMTVTAQNYPLDAPTIINTAVKPIYTLLNKFEQNPAPTTAVVEGSIRYQLSPNETQWYWYNTASGSWVADTAVSDLIESNTASQLTPDPSNPSPNDPIAKFPQQVHPGTSGDLQWKALLVSNGQQRVELDRIDVGYAESSFTLTAPAANETWLAGSTHTITWNKTGSICDVKLEYSPKGDFTTDTQLIVQGDPNDGPTNCNNTGSYNWTLPGTLAVSTNSNPGLGTSRIRISGVESGTESVTDISDPFTVTRFDVTAPASGNLWRLGKVHMIQWTASASSLQNVRIQYSPKGDFTDTLSVVASIPHTGSYDWSLPVDLSYLSNPEGSTNSKIRVLALDPGFAVLTNTSAGFTVTRPFVQILEPHAGEVIGVNTPKDIVWQQEGQIGTNLRIEYSTNAFIDESQTVVIVNGDNGGTDPVGSPCGIYQCHAWVVPDQAASPTVKIRISDLILPEGTGMSEQFKVAGSINVAAPVAGLKWAVGKPHSIQWTTTGQIANVKIELSKDGGLWFPTVIAASVSNPPGGGSSSWTPAAADASANAVIRILDAADPDVKKASAVFLVTDATITNPTGGERWLVGTSKTLTWTYTGLTNARLEYSTDGVTFPNLIAASVPAAAGSLAWTVPDTIKKDTVKIRILDVDATGEAQAQGLSNGFTIHGTLTLTAPTDTDVWNSGQPHTIIWTTPVGTIPLVKIEYSLDNFCTGLGCTSTVITSSTPNDGEYVWTPNFTAGDIVKVRVSDAQDPSTVSLSGFFEVPGIAMQLPAGGEVWPVGSSQTIRWTSTGSFTHVKLEYSTDNFVTPVLVQDNVLNTGNFSWAVPDSISPTVKVRVTPTTEPSLFSTSNAFSIKGVLLLAAPNGSDVFDVGGNQAIAWTTVGTVPTVLLQLSTDGGSSWADLATVNGALGGGTSPVANSYAWTVPDAISAQARVRVTDAVPGHPASADMSDANFTIRAAFALTTPTAADAWAVNQSPSTVPAIAPIQWTTQGTVSAVKLEYLDEFNTARTIVTSAENTGQFDWTVPDVVQLLGDPQVTPSRLARIRVSDAETGHPAASDESEAFTIKWYKITWHVKDAGNQAFLSGLNVTDTSVTPPWDVNNPDCAPAPAPACLVAPAIRYYPYGLAYNTVWSKKGYFNGSANGWAADADKTITVFMESELTATIPLQVHVESAYDSATDTLKFKTWLERRGILIGAQASDLPRLGSSTVEVFDGTALLTTLTAPVPSADGSGSYDFTWSPTGLAAGNVYFARASVVFDGTTRTSGGSINVTLPKQIAAVGGSPTLESDVAAIKGATVGPTSALEEVKTAVTATLPAQITSVQTAIQADVAGVSAQVTNVQATANAIQTDTQAIRPIVEDMGPKVTAILSDPNAGLPALQQQLMNVQDQTKALRRGGILNRDMELEVGESATIQYRTEGGIPTLNVFDGTGIPVAVPSLILNGTTGLYESTFSLAALGEYRAVVTESASADSAGTLDSVALTVRAPVATAQDVTNITTLLNNLDTQIATIDSNITNLMATAAAIQTTTDATKLQADTIHADTQALLGKWGTTADAQALMGELTNLSAKMGAPAQTAKVDDLLAKVADVQSAVTVLKSEQPESGSLMAKLGELQKVIESAEGSAAAVGFSQNAYAAASEAVKILQQLQTEIRTHGSSPGAAALLSAFGDQMGEVSQRLSVTVIPGVLDTKALAAQVTEMAERIKALTTEKGYRFDSLFELTQTQATDVKTMRNRVEELKALIELQRAILEQKVNQPVMKTWFEAQ